MSTTRIRCRPVSRSPRSRVDLAATAERLNMPIQSILIANRGEIAVRIIRAARELGLRTVQVHSEADAESPAVAMADEAVEIGPPHAAKSYLNAAAILAAAAATNPCLHR